MKKFIALAASAAMVAAMLNCMPVSAAGTALGDADGDGKVNSVDASTILSYYAARAVAADNTAEELEAPINSDMNSDGSLNAVDASYVLSYYSYTATGGTMDSEAYMDTVREVSAIPDKVFAEAYPTGKAKNDGTVDISWKSFENDEAFLKKIGSDCTVTGYRIKITDFKMKSVEEGYVNSDVASIEVRDAKDIEVKDPNGDGMLTYKLVNIKLPDDVEIDVNAHYYCEVYAIVNVKGFEKEIYTCYGEPFKAIEFIVNSAKLTPHDNYPLYNIKGSPPRKTATYTVTAADKEILDKFAKEHFTPDMTNYEKIECLWEWVNKNVTYASGDLYKEIASDSWVSACLVKKK